MPTTICVINAAGEFQLAPVYFNSLEDEHRFLDQSIYPIIRRFSMNPMNENSVHHTPNVDTSSSFENVSPSPDDVSPETALSISILFKLEEITEQLNRLISLYASSTQQQQCWSNDAPLPQNNCEKPPYKEPTKTVNTKNTVAETNYDQILDVTSAKNLMVKQNMLSAPGDSKFKVSQSGSVETTTEAVVNAVANTFIDLSLGADRSTTTHTAGMVNEKCRQWMNDTQLSIKSKKLIIIVAVSSYE